jgi:hypothetical protein
MLALPASAASAGPVGTASAVAVGVASAAVVGVASADPVASFRYSFDNGHGLRVLGRNGGTVALTPRGTGRAATFPAGCAAAGCPRAILEGGDDARLDPGTRPFRWGATVRLAATETAAGQNVVQKGNAASGSQWKLQIDGRAGRPSCVLVGRGTGRWYVAGAGVSVADGGWHVVTCARSGGVLSITVDSRVAGRVTVPAGLVVSNSTPLRVGGKGIGADNDQYRGSVDDVFYDRY